MNKIYNYSISKVIITSNTNMNTIIQANGTLSLLFSQPTSSKYYYIYWHVYFLSFYDLIELRLT